MKLDLKSKTDWRKEKTWKVILGIAFLIIAFAICTVAFNSVAENAPSQLTSVLSYVFDGAFLLVIYYYARKKTETEPVDDLNRKKLARHLIFGFIVGFVLFIIIVANLYLFGSYNISKVNFQPSIIQALAIFFFVACAEEIIFRGILFRIIDLRWNYPTAMIVSCITYVLDYSDASFWPCITIAIVGLLLGAAYKLSGTLWFPIGLHCAVDFSMVSLLGLPITEKYGLLSLVNPNVRNSVLLTDNTSSSTALIILLLLCILLTAYFSKKIYQKETSKDA